MNLSFLIRKILLASVLLITTCAQATVLALPAPNPFSGKTYNDFAVYSMSLLDACAAAGDPRCLPSGPFPVKSGPGQISDDAIILTSANGEHNFTSPFASGSPVDDVFLTPTGSQSSTYEMGAFGSEPGGKFTGDLANRWDIKLSLLQSYLNGHDLVFLFDNNQSSGGTQQNVNIWGQVRVVNSLGNLVNNWCWEVSTGAGCDLSADPAPAAAAYLPILPNLCIDKVTGSEFNVGTAGNQNDCNPNGYFVNNNLSTSAAEFAAYNKGLNDVAADSGNGDLYLSVNIKYIANNGGAEQLWICAQCDVDQPRQDVPEPGVLFLYGAGLLALATIRRRA